jgi:hypothetical protein
MSSDDESITVQPKPRYQLRSNTQSFESIFLTVIKYNSYPKIGLSYVTSMVHQSPIGGVN